MLARAQHIDGYGNIVGVVLDSGDRHTGGDASHHRNGDSGGDLIVCWLRRGSRLRRFGFSEAALDHAWRETARRLLCWCGIGLRKLDDFQGSCSVRQAADEAAFFQSGNQPMDAGFRGKVEGIFHLIERWRHAGLFHSLMNEKKQFLLFAREHEENPWNTWRRFAKQIQNEHYMFHMCSAIP